METLLEFLRKFTIYPENQSNLNLRCYFFIIVSLLTLNFSLKLECEKLVSEKTEIQRHYVMYYEMSYGLNIEMHKQSEIVKRLNSIIAQILPFLSQEVCTPLIFIE